MSGKDLFEGMSYVDEKFIDEAEAAEFQTRRMRWGYLAACLCVMILGTVIFARFLEDRQAGQTRQNVADTQPFIHLDKHAGGRFCYVEAPTDPTAVNEVPSVILRVERWTEGGFTATVAELVDTDVFQVGEALNVVLDVRSSVSRDSADGTTRYEDGVPAKTEFPEGSLVKVQFVSYDEETATIRVNLIGAADPAA